MNICRDTGTIIVAANKQNEKLSSDMVARKMIVGTVAIRRNIYAIKRNLGLNNTFKKDTSAFKGRKYISELETKATAKSRYNQTVNVSCGNMSGIEYITTPPICMMGQY